MSNALLKAEHISKHYMIGNIAVHALHPLSFTLYQGEVDPLVPEGLELEAHIELAKKKGALKVPTTAVWTDGDASFVFQVRENRIYKVQVRTGLQSLTES